MTTLSRIEDAPVRAQLERVISASRFADRLSQQKPELFEELIDSGDLQCSYGDARFAEMLSARLVGVDSREELGARLRQFRQREILRILWRDFCRLAETMETTRDMSLLAEASIQHALDYLHRDLALQHGEPRSAQGEPQQLLVIAMGKLGAYELNLSSDIDLIFTYPEAGNTDGLERPLSNQEFFIRLGQRLIAALDQTTAEGFVFRVDMRLRPYGQSGALVLNFAALEEYYQDQGRDWERYALIKARVIAGPEIQRQTLMESLRPFVYRRYIDFGAIDSLRDMKAMISAEMRRRGLQDDVKLGPGGIREVEFIAQCFQLIRGGRSPALQQRELLAVLDACAAEGSLPGEAVAELKAAYLFLRDTEHAIQGYEDKQSQTLPVNEDARSALLVALDFDTWEAFTECLEQHRGNVSGHFAGLIADPGEAEIAPAQDDLWPDRLEPEDLARSGFADAENIANMLVELRDGSRVRYLQLESRKRLDQFMPRLLHACTAQELADLALLRLLPLVQAVVRRSAYLVLLLENPAALQELVRLCAASPWISEQLSRNPVLLDELLDTRSLYSAPDKASLQQQLRQQVNRLPDDDLEAHMEALRYFKASQLLHVAASEVSGRLPLMQVSDRLTFLAEVILEQALAVAWRDLTSVHGYPQRGDEGTGFAVIGYGKLGGIELGHGSDLDLVFIYDAAAQGQTDGERVLDNSVFYTRLGQRIIHILDSRTAMGQLYEIDMRLRPSGNSGMLVTSFSAYREYQLKTAWTWEHQALVRARFIGGDAELGRRFAYLRAELLALPRTDQLVEEVVRMREKMREHLLTAADSADGRFHLKQGQGGIVDIEFIVQYAVLAWSHEIPELTVWSDNVRILETLHKHGLFTALESEALKEAYLAYRSAAHQLSLQQQDTIVASEPFRAHRAAVTDKWNDLLGVRAQE